MFLSAAMTTPIPASANPDQEPPRLEASPEMRRTMLPVMGAAYGLANSVSKDVGEERRGRCGDDDKDGAPVGDALGGGRKDRGEDEDVAVDVGAHARAHAFYG